MPGFVNAHTHLPMALLRGIMDDLSLDEWLNNYIFPTEGSFMNPETVTLGTELACAELFRTGVTCCLDMYYYNQEVAEVLSKVGMRGKLLPGVTSFPGVDRIGPEEKIATIEKLIEKYKEHPLVSIAMGAHAPYTNNEESLRKCIKSAKKNDVLLNMHLAETSKEAEELIKQFGSVSAYIEKTGFLDCKLNFAHCVHLTEKDIEFFAKHNIGVSHNPTSNMKLASGMAPAATMLAKGVNIGIGTDGNSSNNDLDFFEEMRMASFMAKIQANSPTALNAKEIIYMATLGGAKSIFMENQIGSIEPGKRADLLMIDINTVHNSPRYRHNPDGLYGQLVYSTKSTDVTDVMINGSWVMKDKKLQTIDEKPLMEKAQKIATKIDPFIIQLRDKKSSNFP